mmetsp:Transcript_22703/g.53830  ORF Transcript_22703/g.53830 Transcript_22703/m.53830 type:complete len:84 (-) Transcript_22703:655-906(-)
MAGSSNRRIKVIKNRGITWKPIARIGKGTQKIGALRDVGRFGPTKQRTLRCVAQKSLPCVPQKLAMRHTLLLLRQISQITKRC